MTETSRTPDERVWLRHLDRSGVRNSSTRERLATDIQATLAEIERLTRESAHHLEARLNAGKAMQEALDAAAIAEEQRDRLRALVQRAHTIIGIREVAHETHKGKAWLEQATRELNGEPSPAPETFGSQWQPIETAPKDGRTLLLGYFNSAGKWRAMRGQWFAEGSMEAGGKLLADREALETWALECGCGCGCDACVELLEYHGLVSQEPPPNGKA